MTFLALASTAIPVATESITWGQLGLMALGTLAANLGITVYLVRKLYEDRQDIQDDRMDIHIQSTQNGFDNVEEKLHSISERMHEIDKLCAENKKDTEWLKEWISQKQ